MASAIASHLPILQKFAGEDVPAGNNLEFKCQPSTARPALST